ncbi:hypothetical protein [Botrimarina hoheduenensis]|uniref:Transmembrane protein n=1 Tax=Botrimarina hoheduenensis TaxID=2528000 RepID=A0A5C5WEM7_9BACT|nr:hypothetical protein [Botrimarina hoheduenensis]TWT48505.1 hypothetical protein Pla111_02750 [Botrimarina hoheduenensis]
MQATRTLIGALVGLALGIALLMIFIVQLKQDAWWTFIPVGLAIGYSMRVLASTGRESYLRGALAALLTGAAAFLGPQAAAKIVQNKGPTITAAKPAEKASDEASEDAAGGDAIVAEETPTVMESLPSANTGSIGLSRSKNFNPLDAVWLGASVLLAYEFGKGSTRKSDADESDDAEASDDSPAHAADAPATTQV